MGSDGENGDWAVIGEKVEVGKKETSGGRGWFLGIYSESPMEMAKKCTFVSNIKIVVVWGLRAKVVESTK